MLYNLSDELQRANFKTRCNSLFKKGCIVELIEKKPKRTIQQNKYLHVILGYFGAQTGNDLEYVKRMYFKWLCNADLFVREKQDPYLGGVKIFRSTTDLTTEEMTTAIERFRNWSAENGIYIPSAEETDLITAMELEIERNKNYL